MSSNLTVFAIRTPIYHPKNDLIEFILQHTDSNLWEEGSILVITSKIVSLAENRVVPREHSDKKELICDEAEYYLGEMGHGVHLTIKQGLLLAAAGIDESNSLNGDYILHPKDPFASAQRICIALKTRLNLKKLGVILTDSRTGPLRRGVVGVALAFAGFEPLKNMVGHKDLFDRPLKMTTVNVVDSIASVAVLLMGEANESQPLAFVKRAPVQFTDEAKASDLIVPIEEDMYLPLYQHLLIKKKS